MVWHLQEYLRRYDPRRHMAATRLRHPKAKGQKMPDYRELYI